MRLLSADLRRLYLSAFQSHLWNRILAALLWETWRGRNSCRRTSAGRRCRFIAGWTSAQCTLLLAQLLPLPSARTHLEEGPLKSLVDRVLGATGLSLKGLKVDYPRDSFFSKGVAQPCFFPQRWSRRSTATRSIRAGRSSCCGSSCRAAAMPRSSCPPPGPRIADQEKLKRSGRGTCPCGGTLGAMRRDVGCHAAGRWVPCGGTSGAMPTLAWACRKRGSPRPPDRLHSGSSGGCAVKFRLWLKKARGLS